MSDIHTKEAEAMQVEDALVRDTAIRIVDSVRGYTLEHSPSPGYHSANYDFVASELRKLIRSMGSATGHGEETR